MVNRFPFSLLSCRILRTFSSGKLLDLNSVLSTATHLFCRGSRHKKNLKSRIESYSSRSKLTSSGNGGLGEILN